MVATTVPVVGQRLCLEISAGITGLVWVAEICLVKSVIGPALVVETFLAKGAIAPAWGVGERCQVAVATGLDWVAEAPIVLVEEQQRCPGISLAVTVLGLVAGGTAPARVGICLESAEIRGATAQALVAEISLAPTVIVLVVATSLVAIVPVSTMVAGRLVLHVLVLAMVVVPVSEMVAGMAAIAPAMATGPTVAMAITGVTAATGTVITGTTTTSTTTTSTSTDRKSVV